MNMVDYVDEHGEDAAPRLSEGITVLDNIDPGTEWRIGELIDLIMTETDLAPATSRGLVYASVSARSPLFKTRGKRYRRVYIKLDD